MKKKTTKVISLRSREKNKTTLSSSEMNSESSSFIFNMFKYVANMLMLMNGLGAITLLNNNPILYKHSIVSLATGCLVSSFLYMAAYFAYCDMVVPNPKYSGDLKKLKYKYFAKANYCIMASFLFSIVAFYAGLVLFLPGE